MQHDAREIFRFGDHRDDEWYVADPGAPEPPFEVGGDRFTSGWPGEWRRVRDHDGSWLTLHQAYADGSPIVVGALPAYSLTIHRSSEVLYPVEVRRPLLDRRHFALAVESRDHTFRLILPQLGGEVLVEYRAGGAATITTAVHPIGGHAGIVMLHPTGLSAPVPHPALDLAAGT
jgi:hypothetical protein